MENIQIRETEVSDYVDIMEVERKAFGYEKEAELVSQLLEDKSGQPIISLLAFHNNEAIGHILFTKVTFEGNANSPLMYILAPLAVKPGFQNQGVGGMLINKGLSRLKKIDAKMVFVLGHKAYYPKYGFIPDAISLGYDAPYPIPAEHADTWMVQATSSEGLCQVKGKVVCADTLNKPEHWRE